MRIMWWCIVIFPAENQAHNLSSSDFCNLFVPEVDFTYFAEEDLLLDCWISSPEKCLTEVSILLGIYNRFSAVFHCNNGCLQNRRLDIQNLGYVSCSLFLGYDIQYLKWLEMQRHALSSTQLNQQNYQAPYSVYRISLSQFQASSSSHVRMPICTPGSSNTINDDESLIMPTKVSYGPNNLHSRIIKYGEISKLQNNREPEEDFMTDESSEPVESLRKSKKLPSGQKSRYRNCWSYMPMKNFQPDSETR